MPAVRQLADLVKDAWPTDLDKIDACKLAILETCFKLL